MFGDEDKLATRFTCINSLGGDKERQRDVVQAFDAFFPEFWQSDLSEPNGNMIVAMSIELLSL